MREELEVSTWQGLHAGDVVVGADDEDWGVVGVFAVAAHGAGASLAVQLYRLGEQVTGYPPASGAVSVVHRADTRAEEAAWSVLDAAGAQPEVIKETWES